MITELNKEYFYNHMVQYLYRTVFDFKYSYDDIVKWYDEIPLNNVKEYVLIEKKKIDAYNYFLPQLFNGRYSVLFSGGSMVNPQKKGKFVPFFKAVEKRITDLGCDILFGFPNTNSYPIYVNKYGFGWNEVNNFRQLQINGFLNGQVRISDHRKITVHEIKLDARQLASFIRTKEWLRWRVSKPGKKYEIITIDNSYIVYSFYNKEIDCLSILNVADKNDYYKVFTKFCAIMIYFYGHKKVNIFCSDDFLFYKISKKFNFNENIYKRYFCYKVINKNLCIDDMIFVEMIDCDTF